MSLRKRSLRYTGVKMALWGIAAGFFGMIAGMYAWDCLVDGWEFDTGVMIIFLIPWVLSLWRFIVMSLRYKSPEYQEIVRQRKIREYNERVKWREEAPMRKAAAEEEKRRRDEVRRIRAELERQDRTPVAAVLVSTKDITGKSVTGTAARALIGYAVLGVFGAAVGATTAKTKVKAQTATFSVRYESGRTGTETVNVSSERFKELARLLVE